MSPRSATAPAGAAHKPAEPHRDETFRDPPGVRSAALTVLAVATVIAMMWWAQAVLVPVLLAILLTHALEPPIAWLESLRCPRALGVLLVVGGLLVAVCAGAYSLRQQAATFLSQLPASARQLRLALEDRSAIVAGPINRVKQTANELERAAGAAAGPITPAGVTRVRIEEPAVRIGDLAWRSSRGLAELLAQLTLIVFLVYHLLLAGDWYKRRLASIAGPSLSRKRAALRVLMDVDQQLQRFLLARLLISAIVAATSWAVFALLHLSQAGIWAIVAGALNIIPYVGPAVAVSGVTLGAFAQFGTFGRALLVGGAATIVAGI
jgi:predicted PurR-regulated permease PerM